MVYRVQTAMGGNTKRVIIFLVFVALLSAGAEKADFVASISADVIIDNLGNSPVDLAHALPLSASRGRGLGDILLTIDAAALGIDGPSGLSWDGQYLYVVGLYNDSVFVVDPFIPEVVNKWPSPPALSWGSALEQNLWISCVSTDSAYEYTTSGSLTGNAFPSVPGSASYAADGSEWWPYGEIWFVSIGGIPSNQCYKFAVPSGELLDSMSHPLWTETSQRGLTYDPFNQKFWIGGWNSDSVWELNVDGSPTGRSFFMDGCAGLAYDWQSTYHPTPVLWICRQAADQIVMVDADNVQPTFFDFENGEQGWTHTNGGSFPAAWDVVPSTYTVGTFTIAPPDAGDSSFCIDGDSGGVCHDTAMSPSIVNTDFIWFKWGVHFQNYSSNQILTVIMRTSSSSVWNPWTSVLTYTADTPPRYDSVDISGFVADSIQVGFVYDQPHATNAWFAAFDNVGLIMGPEHDVGCFAVLSPPEGSVAPDTYDVSGLVRNIGSADVDFDVVAHVYDTTGMVLIFDQTINLTLAAGSDTNLDLGQVAFADSAYYYTEIFTMLDNDIDRSNDTAASYSHTAIGLGSVIFEMDAQAICNDNQLLGLEFDGELFYIAGGNDGIDPNKVYVVDTSGALLWSMDQPDHSTLWGWRDLAWDHVYSGLDRIDTLYASVDTSVDKFSIDFTAGGLTYHGSIPGPQSPNRALAFRPDSVWFYTANLASNCYRFTKQGLVLQNVPNDLVMHGSAYDDGDSLAGPWIWWHSQDDPGTGFDCQLTQMHANTMTFTGVVSGYALPDTLTSATAAGLCFWRDFNGVDVLFALLNGVPHDYIVGVYVRPTQPTGIESSPGSAQQVVFGFAPTLPTVTNGHVPISYTTVRAGHVCLNIYDNVGRLVQTLVNANLPPGEKSVTWDGRDLNSRVVASGVYFLILSSDGKTAARKTILIR